MKKNTKKLLALLLALSLSLLAMAGCSNTSQPAPDASNESGAADVSDSALESQDPSSADSSSDTGKKVLLVVSFGTSYNDNRDLSIGSIENALQTAYPEYEVRRAFTSQIIIDKLKERDGLEIDNVTQAMDRLVADGIKEVIIQPTHVMNGYEYDDVIAEVTPYEDKFDSFKVGDPLLISDDDYKEVVSILTEQTKEYNVPETAIVFMGHGTEHEANATYAKLQQFLIDGGYNNYFIGTVEATPSLEDVLALVKDSGAQKVVLLPLMIVAGDHANNDMAGDEEDSWKSVFEKEGFEVQCVLEGLGQYAGIQNMFVQHVEKLMAE
ncbi:sirohydrochlorin cobaltochelatase [Youxingia wuxianensis]|uniref:Sirohydrochlorin cobaltochelatase n=1 Tax=Youxingia wuxianensis TaxID=2763678 RepID=A0A926EP02_9FIRM|nr:sirohydrochlorin cobaltochelatase [Youxingia wuxianensis]MBC8586121.1 sirohydrochlorin cobaltochelatase [Youxingia wuxianensis]